MNPILHQYIQGALTHANYEHDKELDVWVGHIPELPGVVAQANTAEETRNQLTEITEEWVLIALQTGDPIGVNS